jgi:hypothetical protein
MMSEALRGDETRFFVVVVDGPRYVVGVHKPVLRVRDVDGAIIAVATMAGDAVHDAGKIVNVFLAHGEPAIVSY